MEKHEPAIAQWLKNSNNPVLYHYSKGSKLESSGWISLHQSKRLGWEHVVAYRIWTQLQQNSPTGKVAVFNVCQGATSLCGFWNAGGRDQKTWRPHSKIETFVQKPGNKRYQQRLQTALQALKDQGYTPHIKSLCWYQGEGDSNNLVASNNYDVLFEDFVYGWKNREGFPHDDRTHYSGSILEICNQFIEQPMTDIPVFVARISTKIKGSPAWGERSSWEPHLNRVRQALIAYTERHPHCNWIDVDDIPLRDNYHYTGKNYANIGEQFAEKMIKTLFITE